MKTIITLLALAGLALGPTTSDAQTDKKWSVDVSLNALAAGLSGDVMVKGIPANLDVGFDQVLEHLNAGAMGAVRVGYDRWAINTEFIYMDLGGSQGGARVDFEQLTVEPTLRYRVCDYFEALAGARYNNLSGSVSLTGPLGTQRASSGTVDWWDPHFAHRLGLLLRSLSNAGLLRVGFHARGTSRAQGTDHYRFTQ